MADETTERFLANIRVFAREVVARHAPAWARGEAPDPAILTQAAGIGLTRIEVPAAFGGLALGFRAKVEACAIIASVDFGLAMALVNTHNVAKRIAISAPSPVATRLLPALLNGHASACTALTEPDAGSDAAAMQCRAERVDGGWVLDGEKTWIVNGRHARYSIVYAQCAGQGRAAGIAAFLVDLADPACTRYAIESAFSQASIGTGGFRLNRCFVRDERLLLPAGTAFKAILEEINGARIYVAAMNCAMVSAALRIVHAYGETRQTFGKPLNQHPSWREKRAECATALAAAWSLVEAAIAATEAGGETRHLAAAAKVNAVTLAQRELPALLHAMGAEGLRETYPFARHIGAAQIAALTDGSTAMLLDRLGRWDPTPIRL
ncbi:MAG: acyl-CoA/acyl-ACP dehydrogenase [Beijerinckiaceae bacterium]|jgi:alkylation response protein AidB-like acyl-CoA dehydrogenase|nr:acyl-CoA/acyl-ACP dehydrogenase [Beijerinckiaceae bacterium]